MTTFSDLQSVARDQLSKLPKQEQTARHQILELSSKVGGLSSNFLTHAPLDAARPKLAELDDNPLPESRWEAPEETARLMGDLLVNLAVCASTCDLDLRDCILKKMALNGKKYPANLCRGKAGKYTKYSKDTGITKTEGQSTSSIVIDDDDNSKLLTIEEVRQEIRNFATERLWARFHTPRNLLLALMGELGELAELFQFRGDGEDSEVLSKEELDKVGQEIADVSIYLLRLSDVCFVKIGDYVV